MITTSTGKWCLKKSFQQFILQLFIQMDTAKPHKPKIERYFESAAVAAAVSGQGWDLQVKRQKPNSPDMSVLDLGFIHSIQSFQSKKKVRTLDQLIDEIVKAFYHEQNKKNLNNMFLSLQQAMLLVGVLESKENNNYKLKYMGKDQLARRKVSPVSLNKVWSGATSYDIANEMVTNVDNFFTRFDTGKRQIRLQVMHPEQIPDDAIMRDS